MLHLSPAATSDRRPVAYAEAMSRLAGIRHALRLVETFAGGPAPDIDQDDAIDSAWDEAGPARAQLFDRRSERLVGATAAGLEALLVEQKQGCAPHQAASHALVDEIRRDLAEIARVVIG